MTHPTPPNTELADKQRSELEALPFRKMTDGEFLKAVGTDAKKWAEAFLQIEPSITLENMTAWFANAIENTRPTISGEDLRPLDKYFGITSDLIGNGCEHGFKPAKSCPNKDCEKAEAHRAWDNLITAKRTEGWQEIASAPKDGTHILVYCPSDRYKVKIAQMCWETNHGYYWEEPDCSTCLPTHWMPLPPQPTAEDGGV